MRFMAENRAKARLAEHLQANGLKGSHQRNLILDAFLSMPPHQTAEDLHRRVSEVDSGIGLSTVYRALKLFCDAGIAAERHFGGGRTSFEQTVGQAHHDHLICEECGTIVEFECQEIEDLQEQMAGQHGFTLTHHRLELFGKCAACAGG